MRLSERCMLVSLNISTFTNSKKDKKATGEVHEKRNIKDDKAGAYTKRLVDPGYLEAIKTHCGACRTFHYKVTAPWINNGADILTNTAFEAYADKIREYNRVLQDVLVPQLIDVWPDAVAKAREKWDDLFNIADYPTQDELMKRYKIEFKTVPFPDSNDFRVNLAKDAADMVRAQIEADIKEAVQFSMNKVWGRVKEAVGKMAAKLKDKDAIFRDSLVENIRELIDILPALNVAGDPNLTKAGEEMKSLLEFKPDELRGNMEKREKIGAEAQKMLDAMAMYGDCD